MNIDSAIASSENPQVFEAMRTHLKSRCVRAEAAIAQLNEARGTNFAGAFEVSVLFGPDTTFEQFSNDLLSSVAISRKEMRSFVTTRKGQIQEDFLAKILAKEQNPGLVGVSTAFIQPAGSESRVVIIGGFTEESRGRAYQWDNSEHIILLYFADRTDADAMLEFLDLEARGFGEGTLTNGNVYRKIVETVFPGEVADRLSAKGYPRQ